VNALVLLGVLAAGPCFEVKEATAGWKRIELTSPTSRLAAFDDVPQFRSGERVKIVDRETGLYRAGQAIGGSTEFELDLPAGAQAVTVKFKESLRGAKVDVTSWGMNLVNEQRVRGDQLSFSWGATDVNRVWVRVHQHLREPPVVMEVEVERLVLPAQLGLPSSFSTPHSLYFFQAEPGQRVMLCEDPNRRLQVTREAVSAGASVITLKASR
jgi:hypothetical protein